MDPESLPICLNKSEGGEFFDEIIIASVVIISEITSKPAAFIVVPVSTRSTIASAKPNPQAASTDPETYLIFVALPKSPRLSKYFLAILGKDVTTLFPANS
jgi:hypothetical protein